MEGWQFALGLATIIISIFGAAIRISLRFANHLAELKSELTNQTVTVNNTMLARLQLAEDNLEATIDQAIQRCDSRTLDIERDVAGFKTYCERQFIPRDTFNVVMEKQTTDRSVMKMELIERLNRIDDKINGRR